MIFLFPLLYALCVFIYYFIFPVRAAWGGGCAARLLYLFMLFVLFSRPRAGLATVKSSFLELATNTLNVKNDNNNNNNPSLPVSSCSTTKSLCTSAADSPPRMTRKHRENSFLLVPYGICVEKRRSIARTQNIFGDDTFLLLSVNPNEQGATSNADRHGKARSETGHSVTQPHLPSAPVHSTSAS